MRSSEGNGGPLAGLGPSLSAVLCHLPTGCLLSLCVHSLPVHTDRVCHCMLAPVHVTVRAQPCREAMPRTVSMES